MLKNNKGITLTSLVVTVIVLLILASVATVSGLGAIDYIKFNNARVQLQIMQSQVDLWYEEAKNNDDVINYGVSLTDSSCNQEKLTITESAVDNINLSEYKYFESNYIKNNFDIDGISYDFLINIKTRSVLLFGGVEYHNKIYCSAEDFGIKIVEHEEIVVNATYKTSVENGYIIIYDINLSENISRYNVKYNVDNEEFWTTLTYDMKEAYEYEKDGQTIKDNNAYYIPIERSGKYNIKIATTFDNIISSSESDPVEITIENIKNTTFVKNAKLIDTNGDIITVPAKFKISNESPNLIKEGIIIEDSKMNQYIWIPIFEKSDNCNWGADYSNVQSKDDYSNIELALKSYTNDYIGDSCDLWYGDAIFGKNGYYDENDTEHENLIYYTCGNMTEEEYQDLYHEMLKSVYENKGFFIGRYEMGIKQVEDVAEAKSTSRIRTSREYVSSSTDFTNNQKVSIDGMVEPISKNNAIPYNWITQSQAQMLAKKIEKENTDYINVGTSLMFDIQWNSVCVFMEKYGQINENALESVGIKFSIDYLKNNEYSKYWGNYINSTFKLDRGFYTTKYSNTTSPVVWNEINENVKIATTETWLYTTGASDQNKCLNIYDFAGNLYEYTLGRFESTISPCSLRGGSLHQEHYASHYAGNSTVFIYWHTTSRLMIYIK